MRRLFAIAALLLSPLAASAETLEFDLSGVVGHYDGSTTTRLDTLTYSRSRSSSRGS